MDASFTLQSRRIVFPDGIRPGAVTIRSGRIERIGVTPEGEGDGLDLGDDVLLPALTDTHVHIDEPGRTEWEGFKTATRAAAAGGVTLLVDMPLNSDPVTTSLSALHQKLDAARGQLWVDCAFWGGVVPGNAAELAPMVEAGVLGFKCFLCPSGIDEFPPATRADLERAMPILRGNGVPLLVHAELEGPVDDFDGAPSDYRTYLHSRPKVWEDRAVALVADLVRQTGCPAHIVHLSSAGALDVIRKAKAEGLPLTAETCPHYLGLAAEEVPQGATEFKCAPPIRERANQDLLWAALQDGTLDFVVTDHSPCVPALKRFDTGDFLGAWGGIASLQLGLRSVWTEAHRRGISFDRVVHWMARATASFAGRPDRGVIEVGAVADLVAFRPEEEAVVEASQILHRHATSPWVGRTLRGRVQGTWLRGVRVAEEGRVTGPPSGALVLGTGLRQERGERHG